LYTFRSKFKINADWEQVKIYSTCLLCNFNTTSALLAVGFAPFVASRDFTQLASDDQAKLSRVRN